MKHGVVVRRAQFSAILGGLLALAGCGGGGGGGSSTQTFALQFEAVDGDRQVGCGDVIEGLGPNGITRVAISDLRFYVSNLQFFTASGKAAKVQLDANDFQYISRDGTVALIDLTGTNAGACAGEGLTFPEGTARVNDVISGRVSGDEITRVSFDVGIPQHLMKEVISDHTAEDAPSPLAEMHWSWAFAYRHLVMNFTVTTDGVPGEGYLHVGSTECGGDGTKALTDREACGKLNTPQVSLSPFDMNGETIAIDVRALLAGLDFEVSSEEATGPGVACHSFAQPDCPTIFGNLGLDQDSGAANADLNSVFWAK